MKFKCHFCGYEKSKKINLSTTLMYEVCEFCAHSEIVCNSHSESFQTAQTKYFSTNLQTLENNVRNEQIFISNLRIKHLKQYLPYGSRVIEVGPGLGVFASKIKQEGYEVSLVEHSSNLVDSLRENIGCTIYKGEFEKVNLQSNYFDAFCSFHVIEHVIDPVEHLKTGLRVVKPGGYAFIATPSASSWQQKLFPKLSPNFDSAHLRVFSLFSLEKICEEAEWEVIMIKTPEYSSAWLRTLSRLIRKIKKEDFESTAGKYTGNKTLFFSVAFSLISIVTFPFRQWQSISKGGNELFLVLRKSNPR